MGTRGLTMVVHDKQTKVAQYSQWDGYPEGQGETIRHFLRYSFNRAKFMKALKRAQWIVDTEVQAVLDTIGSKDGWLAQDQSDKFNKFLPFLSRDHGGKILGLIQNARGKILLQDNSEFAADSLFCEWAYVVDLDNNFLEVYKGFNEKPVPAGERFANLPLAKERTNKYYQVRFVVKFPLSKLPTKKDFLQTIADLTKEESKLEEKAANLVGTEV